MGDTYRATMKQAKAKRKKNYIHALDMLFIVLTKEHSV